MIRHILLNLALGLIVGICVSCNHATNAQKEQKTTQKTYEKGPNDAEATLAGGCFWCVEAVFERLTGVKDVVSGFAGGTQENPTYDEVARGATDYAESVNIVYDTTQISYKKLLDVFFSVVHDPTQLNRQGPDVGKQYRSAVFYRDEQQKEVAGSAIKALKDAGKYEKPIVTQVEPLDRFYAAEAYHQNFYENHPNHSYITRYAVPKVAKLKKKYPEVLKSQYSQAKP